MATYYLDPAGSDTNPGTSRGAAGAWRTISKARGTVAAGDTVYVLGVAGNAASYPTTGLDYTNAGYATPTAGSAAAGYIKWIKDPTGSTPTIGVDGLTFLGATMHWFENLYIVATSNSAGSFGIIECNQVVVKGCTFNLNAQSGMVGLTARGGLVTGCEFLGSTSTPTLSAGSRLIVIGTWGTLVIGNRLRNSRDAGIYEEASNAASIVDNRVSGCVGNGIQTLTTGSSNASTTIQGNTIDSNSGHGIAVTGAAGIVYTRIFNNVITNHTGSGKAGIAVTDGTSTLNDARKMFCDYNDLYNNTSNYSGISAGAHDLTANPQYTDAANGNYTPANSALQAGYP